MKGLILVIVYAVGFVIGYGVHDRVSHKPVVITRPCYVAPPQFAPDRPGCSSGSCYL